VNTRIGNFACKIKSVKTNDKKSKAKAIFDANKDKSNGEIAQMIAAYEPRVILQKVNVEANDAQNAYNVTISFFLQNATTAS
jgi:predicted component of type VI protein secretion system